MPERSKLPSKLPSLVRFASLTWTINLTLEKAEAAKTVNRARSIIAFGTYYDASVDAEDEDDLEPGQSCPGTLTLKERADASSVGAIVRGDGVLDAEISAAAQDIDALLSLLRRTGEDAGPALIVFFESAPKAASLAGGVSVEIASADIQVDMG